MYIRHLGRVSMSPFLIVRYGQKHTKLISGQNLVIFNIKPPLKKNLHLPVHMSKQCLRATSHTILRAHDQYTSSTLIGGKGGAGPSLLHTTLEGPTEYVN